MSYYLVLVSPLDAPVYEAFLTSSKASSTLTVPAQTSAFSIFGSSLPSTTSTTTSNTGLGISQSSQQDQHAAQGVDAIGYGTKTGPNGRHVMQLIAHSSLDVLEDVMWSNGACYLKSMDKFMEWTVSAFLTTGGMRILLLHEVKNDDGIRAFFMDIWEAYVKTLMNPFHAPTERIRSRTFDARIRASAKKHL